MASYDLNKIKFATDEATFKRAVGLYENGKAAGYLFRYVFNSRNRAYTKYV